MFIIYKGILISLKYKESHNFCINKLQILAAQHKIRCLRYIKKNIFFFILPALTHQALWQTQVTMHSLTMFINNVG